MLTKAISWTVLAYGIVLICLGYIGYMHTGSKISLYSGSGFGILLILCSLAMFAKNKLGAYIAIILTLFLTGIFAYRYTITERAIPAIFAVISGGMLLFLIAQIANWNRKRY